MIARLSLILLVVAGIAPPVNAETLSTPAALAEQTREFMEKAAEGEINAAYTGIRPFLGVPVDAFDASADEASVYFSKVRDKAGKTLDYARVRHEAIADDFHRVVWLQKFAAAAIAWTFTFYQPDDGWKLVGVSYSTTIDDLYQTVRSPGQ